MSVNFILLKDRCDIREVNQKLTKEEFRGRQKLQYNIHLWGSCILIPELIVILLYALLEELNTFELIIGAMKLFDYLERVRLFHKLVEQRRTGTPEEFAERLHISRSCLYELIEELKSRGAATEYSVKNRFFTINEMLLWILV